MADDVNEGVLRGRFVGGVPVSDGLNAVAGEELDGVVAEAGVELSEFTFGGFVDAELEGGVGSQGSRRCSKLASSRRSSMKTDSGDLARILPSFWDSAAAFFHSGSEMKACQDALAASRLSCLMT